jgi:hypothetical protein
MKSFLKRTGIFLFILLLLFVSAFGVMDYLVNQRFDSYRVDPKITVAFMGDSHPQCAVNDAFLPNARNFAQAAEASYYTYFKMKALLENNPSIKKVYLGLGYHNISTHYDQYIYGSHAKDIAARYFFILPLKEKLSILAHNPKDAIDLLENSWSNGLKNQKLDNAENTILGHYENFFVNVAARKSSIDKRLKLQFTENGRLRDFSEFNIDYFEKMVNLCRSKNVELVIINTPVHPYYKSKIPVKFRARYDEILNKNHLELFSFDALTLNDSAYVPDGDHISAKGAVFTTALFKE